MASRKVVPNGNIASFPLMPDLQFRDFGHFIGDLQDELADLSRIAMNALHIAIAHEQAGLAGCMMRDHRRMRVRLAKCCIFSGDMLASPKSCRSIRYSVS